MVRTEEPFALKIKGDSMIEAGILEGDYVIVKQQQDAQQGDIVVALIGDEATVKRFYRASDHVKLQECVHDVERCVEYVPTVTISFAKEMPHSYVKKISEWLFDQYQTWFFLDIQINKQLIGGFVVYRGGVYHDYSLNHTLEQMAEKGELRLSYLFSDERSYAEDIL